MNTKVKFGLAIFATCLIVATAVTTFLMFKPAGEELSSVTEQVTFQSYVTIDVYRPAGGEMVLIYHNESHNVITNVGLFVIARGLANQTGTWQWIVAEGGNGYYYSVGDPRYIALSSDDTGADATHSSWQAFDGSYSSDIEITTGGLGRGTGTFTQAVAYTPGSGTTKGSYTYSMSRTFTVAAGNSFDDVQKAGLFTGTYNTNPGTSGSPISPLVAENTFAPVDLSAGDQIAVTWRITL